MVKFGKHNAVVRDRLGADCYVVNYDTLKSTMKESSSEAFEAMWRESLASHVKWVLASTQQIWAIIFQKVSKSPLSRGVTPDGALQLFVHIHTEADLPSNSKEDASIDASPFSTPAGLLRYLKRLELASSTNFESLRKSIKKYDKQCKSTLMSAKLLPELYMHAFSTGPIQFRHMIQTVTGLLLYMPEKDRKDQHSKDNKQLFGRDSASDQMRARKSFFRIGESPVGSLVKLRSKNRLLLGSQNSASAGWASSNAAKASVHEDIASTSFTELSASSDSLGVEKAPLARTRESSEDTEGVEDSGDKSSFRLASFRAMQNEFDRRRRKELLWLHRLSDRLSKSFISKLVLHRGFHSGKDGGDRPIENSLTAYESAWSAGIRYCECDIALTADEYVVLCHDENFKRLALFGKYATSHDETMATSEDDLRKIRSGSLPVGEMTYREIIGMPLKSGQRPPLLEDVLESALAIGGGSQLVIEIKKGNPRSAEALCQLFRARPKLLEAVAVVMSFDLWVIHEFNKSLKLVIKEESDVYHKVNISASSSGLEGGNLDAPTEKTFPHRPKVLLLTVSEETDEAPYLYLSLERSFGEESTHKALVEPNTKGDGASTPLAAYASEHSKLIQEKVRDWTTRDGSVLDGVYLQFEKCMLNSPGKDVLKTPTLKKRAC